MDSYTLWYMSAYFVGTIVGMWLGHKLGVTRGAEATIDALLSENYIKYTKNGGNIKLFRIDEEIS